MRRNQRTRLLSLILAAALVLSLAACGETQTHGGEAALPEGIGFQRAPFYQAEEILLPESAGYVAGSCGDGEKLYYLLEDEDRAMTLYRADLAADTVEELPDFASAPADSEPRPFPRGLTPDGAGGLWLLETQTVFTYDLPADFDEEKDDKYQYRSDREDRAFLRRLDGGTGREIESRELTGLTPDFWEEWQGDWTVDGGGRLCLAHGGGVTVLDKAGAPAFDLEARVKEPDLLSGSRQALALLADGSVGVMTGTEKETKVKVIDPAKKGWSETVYAAPAEAVRLYSGQGTFLFFCATKEALYGYTAGETDPYKLLEWSAAGVSGGAVQTFALWPEGRAALLACSNGKTVLSRLTPSDTAADGRAVITLGTVMPNLFLTHEVQRFNGGNDSYYVVVRDYAEDLMDNGMTYEERYSAALKRLEIEMVSGQVPDLLDGQLLPLARYAGKGILEDLWPWIDADPDLGRDKLMTHVLDCASQDGKLYQIDATFSIQSLTAPVGRFPEGSRPDLEEVLTRYEAMPEGSLLLSSGMGPAYVLDILSLCGGSFVDWTAGTCSFDSPEFAKLLELCARTPQDTEWLDDGGRALRAGRQLLTNESFGNLRDFLDAEARCGGPEALWDYEKLLRDNGIGWGGEIDPLFNTSEDIPELELNGYVFGDDTVFGALKEGQYASYVGFPTLEGSAAGIFSWSAPYAMTAASARKDGAWAFLRELLLPGGAAVPSQYDENGSVIDTSIQSFPVNRADFEAFLAAEMEATYFTDKDWEILHGGQSEDAALILDQDGQPIQSPGLLGFSEIGRDPISLCVYHLAARQSDYERFMALYDEVDRFDLGRDEALWDIVKTQAAPYFAGDVTLDEAVRNIQLRAELYVGEQK